MDGNERSGSELLGRYMRSCNATCVKELHRTAHTNVYTLEQCDMYLLLIYNDRLYLVKLIKINVSADRRSIFAPELLKDA